MPQGLQIATFFATPNVCRLRLHHDVNHAHFANMAEEPRNHLKAWREYRRMTQEELAVAVETTPAVISLLESGKRALSPKWLWRLAPILKTRPGMLLEHDPETLDSHVMEVWATIPEMSKPQAMRVLEQFQETKVAS
jgi:transcriptional regulator with XRE-family HTH domain